MTCSWLLFCVLFLPVIKSNGCFEGCRLVILPIHTRKITAANLMCLKKGTEAMLVSHIKLF